MSEKELRQLPLTALFIAIGIVLPQLFHLLGLGSIFLPMFLPVYLAALFLSLKYSILVALLTPTISFLITGMPPIVPPILLLMLLELSVGVLIIWGLYIWKKADIFLTLAIAIFGGRIIYFFFVSIGLDWLGYESYAFPLAMTFKGFPGIILQLTLIPLANRLITNKYPRLSPRNHE
ncbi:MAG: ECF transporter S component [Bacteroidetes bacterium]|nr:ECF transporter S component [Bacteroidota bacterium]